MMAGIEREREDLRARDQVRPLTDAEEGLGARRLPNGVYGFTYAPVLQDFPLFQAPRSNTFEVHKLADGTVTLVGFVTQEAASRIENGAGEIPLRLFPSPREEAVILVSIPLSRVARLREHSTRQTGGLDVHLDGAS